MPLTTGCSHVALITADLDRFIRFYSEVFGGEVLCDIDEGEVRHALVHLGGGFALHPFQLTGGSELATASPAVFERGHLDHLALDVGDEATLQHLRARLVEVGASDGELTDFGMIRSVSFTDPDGMDCEITCWASGEVRRFADRGREAYAAVAS